MPDGRTDIPLYVIEIFLKYGEHDPHAIVECKRLVAGDTDLCREYVVEGVDRFRTGKYGDNHVVGFMAGYLLKGDAAAAAAEVNAYLHRAGRAAEGLNPSALISDPIFWESMHPRAALGGPIALHHAFFTVPVPTC